MYLFFPPLDGDKKMLTRLQEEENRETEVSVVKTIFIVFSTKKIKNQMQKWSNLTTRWNVHQSAVVLPSQVQRDPV